MLCTHVMLNKSFFFVYRTSKLTCYNSPSFRMMNCSLWQNTSSIIRTSGYRKIDRNLHKYGKTSRIEERVTPPLFLKIADVSRYVLSHFIYVFSLFVSLLILYHVFLHIFLFASLSMFILYGLYFDDIDVVDDKHVVDAFFPRHSQYLAFSFNGGGLSRLGDKGRYLFARSIFGVYIFFYSVHVLMLVKNEVYDWMKKTPYTLPQGSTKFALLGRFSRGSASRYSFHRSPRA